MSLFAKALRGLGAQLGRMGRGRSWSPEKPAAPIPAAPGPRGLGRRAQAPAKAPKVTRRTWGGRTVKRPGSRGGKFYYDHHNHLQYGTPLGGDKGFGTYGEFVAHHANWTTSQHTAQAEAHAALAVNDRPWVDPTPSMRMHGHLAALHQLTTTRKFRGDPPHSDLGPITTHMDSARAIAAAAVREVEHEAAVSTAPFGMTDQIEVLRRAGWQDVSRTAVQMGILRAHIDEAAAAHEKASLRLRNVRIRSNLAAPEGGKYAAKQDADLQLRGAEFRATAAGLEAAKRAIAHVTSTPHTYRHPQRPGVIVIDPSSQGWTHTLHAGAAAAWTGTDAADLATHVKNKGRGLPPSPSVAMTETDGDTIRNRSRTAVPARGSVTPEEARAADRARKAREKQDAADQVALTERRARQARSRMGKGIIMRLFGRRTPIVPTSAATPAPATSPAEPAAAVTTALRGCLRFLAKANVKAYRKRSGAMVAAHSDSRNAKVQKYGPALARFPSKSSPGTSYTVRKGSGGLSCNCPGWANKRRCRHTDQVQSTQGGRQSRRTDAHMQKSATLPAHIFLDGYPVKTGTDTSWEFDAELLAAAARESRRQGRTALADRADLIRGRMAKSLVDLAPIAPAFDKAFESIQAASPVNLPAYLLGADATAVIALFPVGRNGADVALSIPYVSNADGFTFDWQAHTPAAVAP